MKQFDNVDTDKQYVLPALSLEELAKLQQFDFRAIHYMNIDVLSGMNSDFEGENSMQCAQEILDDIAKEKEPVVILDSLGGVI